MLQDRPQTFQNWCKNGLEQLTGSWQPPSKNERNLMQLILTFFWRGFANFKLIFLRHFSTNFERFGAYPAAFNTPIFSFSDGFQSSYGHVSRDPCFFFTHPVYIGT